MKRAMMMLGMILAVALPTCAQTAGSRDSVMSTALVAPNTQTQALPKPVARVNRSVLTDHDLLREMYLIFPYA